MGRFLSVKFNKNTVRVILPSSSKAIKKLLAHEQYDVIHVGMPYNPFMGKKVIRYAGPKTAMIGTFHTYPASKFLFYSNHVLSLVLGRSLRRFDKVLGVSEPVVHFARKAYNLNAEYVPNPVSLEEFKTGKRMREYRQDKLNIVFLGRLVERKGIMELINAYNALDDETAKQTRLIVGGKGVLAKKAKQLVHKDRNVVFTGFISDKAKADFLATADIAVFPSLSGEAFGLVLIEAMAAGAGVVLGGNNPGYKSVLGAQPYLLFDPTNVDGFAAQLKQFITDKRLRERMHAWQEHAVQQYDIPVVGATLVKVYKEALLARKDMQ
jgi:phosphatidylinositol alpha-mannosyltransferase